MRQLEKEKQKKEHILVCLSSSPSNEKIIRTAAQMAQAFQAGFTALYVQTAEKTEKTGDNSPILAYVFGAMAGALILAVSFLKKRKKMWSGIMRW